jgi:hypothetical protein
MILALEGNKKKMMMLISKSMEEKGGRTKQWQ